MDMPKISIIIPVYNAEKYLRACLLSAQTQTYKNIEIIIINDGSSDGSAAICTEFAAQDNRITYISQENAGQSAARNAGLALASGDYICFLDADDAYLPDYCEALLTAAQMYGADITACGYFLCDANGTRREAYTGADVRCFEKGEAVYSLFQESLFSFVPWNKLYKADLFQDTSFAEGRIMEDAVIVTQLLHKATKCVHIGSAKYQFTINPTSTMGSPFSIKKIDAIWSEEEKRKVISAYYPDLAETAALWEAFTFINTYIYFIRHKGSDKPAIKEKLFRESESSYKYLITCGLLPEKELDKVKYYYRREKGILAEDWYRETKQLFISKLRNIVCALKKRKTTAP